jgi:glutamine amidotransferase
VIGIIKTEVGNSTSIGTALKKININFKFCENYQDLKGIKKLILPGVGAFSYFMNTLKKKNLLKEIKKFIMKGNPILGICVGFQSFFSKCYEFGEHEGFDLIPGEVKSLNYLNNNLRIPHVGWNNFYIKKNDCVLLKNLSKNNDFYFTHSFANFDIKNSTTIAYSNYNLDFVSIVNVKNIYGVQFHPEKSQKSGLILLENFCNLC